MLWVYGQYKYLYLQCGDSLRRQILTTKVDPRAVRVDHLALKQLNAKKKKKKSHPLKFALNGDTV